MKFSFSDAGIESAFEAEHALRAEAFAQALWRDSGGYAAPEDAFRLPLDPAIGDAMRHLYAEKNGEKVRLVFLVGIGGSNLGAQAAYDALAGQGAPEFVCLDTVSPEQMLRAERALETVSRPEEVIVFVVSKSGATAETVLNADALEALCARRGIGLDRWVAVTDDNSPLFMLAGERGIATISVPHAVGGRYSVFSLVGAAPLAFLLGPGVVERLRAGAGAMASILAKAPRGENPGISSALVLYWQIIAGKTVHDTFFFDARLESVGRWYRQLLAESVGKVDTTGKETGIVPTVSIGSTDLHSVGQLYLGGLRTVYTTFVSVAPLDSNVPGDAPAGGSWVSLAPGIAGVRPSRLLEAIREGTAAAYRERGVPFSEARLLAVSPEEIGAFMQWKIGEVMLLGRLLGVNPFDQPAVESYKQKARAFLAR